jgi:hypothetical protein
MATLTRTTGRWGFDVELRMAMHPESDNGLFD